MAFTVKLYYNFPNGTNNLTEVTLPSSNDKSIVGRVPVRFDILQDEETLISKAITNTGEGGVTTDDLEEWDRLTDLLEEVDYDIKYYIGRILRCDSYPDCNLARYLQGKLTHATLYNSFYELGEVHVVRELGGESDIGMYVDRTAFGKHCALERYNEFIVFNNGSVMVYE